MEKEIRQLCRASLIPLQYVPKEKLHSLCNKANHQGVVAQKAFVDYLSIEQVLPHIYESGKTPFLLVLDGIEDVRNIGALSRSAYWFGIDAIVVSLKKTARINSFAMKASAGALNYITVCREKNLKDALEYIKSSGVHLVIADSANENSSNTIDYSEPIALVLGSEGEGVSKETLKMADKIVSIPGAGNIDSLNVSAAGAILMHSLYLERDKTK